MAAELAGKPEWECGSSTSNISGTATGCRCYSHARSSGLDLARKVSSTLALRESEFGCEVVALTKIRVGNKKPFSEQT